ncbi:MAG TPA: DUF177 domain-containing protein, partial [Pyrinomonadaceae bacterium]|nr:DUF177 domain-containing protein [Pyrinomonadaceae bacterium]
HGRAGFAHVYQPDELGSFDERVSLVEPAAVKGTVRLAGTEVFVNGQITTRAAVECDRCLKQVELPVEAAFALEYVTGQAYESAPVAELTEDEMSISVFDGETIDVDEIVKEQIVLAVPTRMLCRPDCKGICPECGIDKNTGDCACATDEVDPRWAALKNLTSGK